MRTLSKMVREPPKELRIHIFKNSSVIKKLPGSPPPVLSKIFRETKESDSEPKSLGFKLDNFVLTGTESQLSPLIIFRVTTKALCAAGIATAQGKQKAFTYYPDSSGAIHPPCVHYF